METQIPPKPRLKEVPKGLHICHLSKSYKKRPVLRDVSFSLQRGEAVALLGPNGAGKTTSFYITTGLIAPDSGNIILDGQDITNLPMYRRARLGIGYLPQESSIFRGLTVEENIRAVLEHQDLRKDYQELLLDDPMGEFGITHLSSTPSVELSGGERRRVEFARALSARPQFILLDEPLAGIDPIAVADIRELIAHLKDRGIGVLITDHNVRDTLDICETAFIVGAGHIIASGSAEPVLADAKVREIYLGDQFHL